jgi:hypothetical protein
LGVRRLKLKSFKKSKFLFIIDDLMFFQMTRINDLFKIEKKKFKNIKTSIYRGDPSKDYCDAYAESFEKISVELLQSRPSKSFQLISVSAEDPAAAALSFRRKRSIMLSTDKPLKMLLDDPPPLKTRSG